MDRRSFLTALAATAAALATAPIEPWVAVSAPVVDWTAWNRIETKVWRALDGSARLAWRLNGVPVEHPAILRELARRVRVDVEAGCVRWGPYEFRVDGLDSTRDAFIVGASAKFGERAGSSVDVFMEEDGQGGIELGPPISTGLDRA